MTAEGASATGQYTSLDGEAIEIRRRNGEVHAWYPSMGLHASAGSADAALAELDKKMAALEDFEARSGLDARSRLCRGRGSGDAGASGWVRRLGVPVLIGGFVALQLGWAVSLGLSNGLGRAFNSAWRDNLLISLERQVLAHAEPKADLSADQQQRMIAAVRALKARYGPIWDEMAGAPANKGAR